MAKFGQITLGQRETYMFTPLPLKVAWSGISLIPIPSLPSFLYGGGAGAGAGGGCMGPSLNKKFVSYPAPKWAKKGRLEFFFIISKTSRLAVFSPTRHTGNSFLLKGGLGTPLSPIATNFSGKLLNFDVFPNAVLI